MTRADPIFRLRLPDALRVPLEEAAAEKGRTLTAEILDRLNGSIDKSSSPSTSEKIKKLISHVNAQHIRLRFYEQNISLYAVASIMLNAFAKTSIDAIGKLKSRAPSEDISSWDTMRRAVLPMMEIVEKFEVPDPADRGALVARPEETEAALQAMVKIRGAPPPQIRAIDLGLDEEND
jgi:hypothetical protein